MPDARITLEEAVLEVFEYACQQHDFEVAEHLLRALEVIAQRGDDQEALETAMWTLTHSLVGNGRHS